MELLISIIVFGGIYAWAKISQERKLDNYDMSKVDITKLNRDVARGVSVGERRRRCINGYYDKK